MIKKIRNLDINYIQYGKAQILQRVSSDSNSFIDFVNSKYKKIEGKLILLFL